jgi:arylsulfatase A-like enzyme
MKNYRWISTVVLCAWMALVWRPTGATQSGASNKRPPNFIIILADDLGYNDLSCYWTEIGQTGVPAIETPNIDRMASEGVRFTDFYVAASTCTPSRAALLTGCYPPRVGMSRMFAKHSQVLDRRSTYGLHPNEVTIAEMLKACGYVTACIGKWHLGELPEFLPTRQGFDEYYGVTFRLEGLNPVMRGDSIAEQVDNALLTHRYTEETIKFIETNRDRPFFVYLSHGMPHYPITLPKECQDKSPRGGYGDAVMCVDHSTGEILETLKRLGIDEHTMVVFLSDNGPQVADPFSYSAYPLSGGKATMAEGGFRVPCIVRWPGTVPKGRTNREMCTAMDFLPTFAKLAHGDLPRVPIDGKDITPLLMGDPGSKTPHKAFFYYKGGMLMGVRSGKWKLLLAERRYRHSPRERDAAVDRLFDLRHDLSEKKNRITRQKHITDALRQLIGAMRGELGDLSTGQAGRGNRPAGYVDADSTSR